ncbi:glycoside hydrolase superfamily [Catenaria anguillulae PL171]|uniref:Glycoside hydrolase superfamily n=1 Tax=Catenaria anguillulae PL171 TaxID=765915 RepID=A0A1Y2I1T5_9FUNG|nr:glycoside hydrolase superfamily [Catenaria anguillulae PL171]
MDPQHPSTHAQAQQTPLRKRQSAALFDAGSNGSADHNDTPLAIPDDDESDKTTFDPVQSNLNANPKLASSSPSDPIIVPPLPSSTLLPSNGHLNPFLSGAWFVDRHHRRLLLRGVNLSGNAKSPYEPLLPSHVADGFFRDLSVSFVGRPFPLADADYHFSLLRAWGFNAFRFCLTWEAIEHLRAAEVGLTCFLDPHQDVWSRHCGGDGAPNWTLRLVGLDATGFYESGAAMCHSTWCQRTGKPPGEYPKMIWQTNYFKLAAATMFTLFFGGDLFAPWLVPDHASPPASPSLPWFNSRDFLQAHFIPPTASQLVPAPGYIGCPDISRLLPWQALFNGACPTPLQGMAAGAGHEVSNVATYTIAWCGPMRNGECLLNTSRTSAWMAARVSPAALHAQGLAAAATARTRVFVNTDPLASDCTPVTLTAAHLAFPSGGCIWAAHGVFDPLTGVPLDPENFTSTLWIEFAQRFASAVRKVDPKCIVFLDTPVNEEPPNVVGALQGFGSSAAAAADIALAPPSPAATSTTTVTSPRSTLALDEKPSAVTDRGMPAFVPLASATSTSTLSTPASTSSSSTPGHILPAIDPTFARDLVYAPHWYDGLTLITKHLWPYNNWITGLRLGYAQVRAGMAAQLALIRDEGHHRLGNVPVLLGEIGIPFDMDPVTQSVPSRQAELAMDANLAAIESALVHATLWNYCPDNERAVGDGWNGEDLSVILQGQPRPMRVLLRPVPWAAAGTVVRIRFDAREHEAEVCIQRTDRVCGACMRDPPGAWTEGVPGALNNDSAAADERLVSQIYVPWLHFRGPDKSTVALSHGACMLDFRRQVLRWVHGHASGCQYCGGHPGEPLTSVDVTHRVQIKGRFDGGEDEFEWDPKGRLDRDGCKESEYLLKSWEQPGDRGANGCVGGLWEAVKDCFGCGGGR